MSTPATATNGNGYTPRIEALEKGFSSLVTKIDSIEKAVTTFTASRGTFNLQSIGMVITIGAVVWAAVRLQFQADLGIVIAEQARSQTERSENRRMSERNSDSISDIRAQVAHLIMAGAEVETQCKALENYLAMSSQETDRNMAPLYEKVLGLSLPIRSYHPTIAQPKNIQVR